MRSFLLYVLIAAASLTVAGSAAAEETRHPVLLPVEGDRSIPSLTDEIARTFTLQGKVVLRSSLKLEDLMLAVGCKAISVACLQNIGQNVKASGLIIARAKRVKDGVELSLRWFDVKSGGDVGEFLRLLPTDSIERAKILNQAVRTLVGRPPASSPEQTGGLSISASVPYVEIVIDGQARGSVPLELRNLRAGSYSVVARREGFITAQQKVEVRPDRVTHLQIEMTVAPARPAPVGYVESIRTTTWALGGAGLVCIAIGAAFAAHLNAQQDHLDSTQGITPDEIRQMQDYKETGERDAIAADVLFGLGGAALVTSAVLSYFDYRRGRSEASRPSVSVGPGSVALRVGF